MTMDLSAVTAALGVVKSLTGIAKDVNNVEFNQKIIELQQKLLDIQMDYGSLLDENRTLKAEIEAEKTLTFHHSVYWKRMADESERGPFCPICYGEHKRTMPLDCRGSYSGNANLLLFICPIRHVEPGHGRNTAYQLPAKLIPPERYSGH